MEREVIPSTSFSGAITSHTLRTSIPSGRGRKKRIPWIALSAFIRLMRQISSSSVTQAGSTCFSIAIPRESQRFVALRSYDRSPGRSPMRIIPRQGTTPFSASAAMRVFRFSLSASATGAPFHTSAGIVFTFRRAAAGTLCISLQLYSIPYTGPQRKEVSYKKSGMPQHTAKQSACCFFPFFLRKIVGVD